MTEEETRKLYELVHHPTKRFEGVFVIGSLMAKGERVAVASQQIRAINLVHSLCATGFLKEGSRICVIGGGAAGLTAAAYAISKKLRVTVLEQRAPLWNLRGCRTRWLHPNLFRHWPNEEWQCTATRLPVMNWYAGYAFEVGELLYSKYLAFEAYQRSQKGRGFEYPGVQIARDIEVHKSDLGWRVSWQFERVPCSAHYDAVIVAVGFGNEARARDAEASVYWLDDTLERETPARLHTRYLICGAGDGGLTDLLRVRVRGFRHHHLRDSLLGLNLFEEDLQNRVKELKAEEKRGVDPTAGYLSLAERYRLDHLLGGGRQYTSAILTSDQETALKSGAWSVSRFLAAQLLVHDDVCTKYVQGPVTWKEKNPAASSAGAAPLHPAGFEVTFSPKGKPKDACEVDAIVFRYGPARVPTPGAAGTTTVRYGEGFLLGLGIDPAAISAAEDAWKQVSSTEQETDALIAPPHNAESDRRSRGSSVLPVMSGRTVLGMLSRLVGSIGPLNEIRGSPLGMLKIQNALVGDDIASLLTPLGDRPSTRSNHSQVRPWRLSQEVDHQDIVEVIVAADTWLATNWSTPDVPLEESLRNWILPRPKWGTVRGSKAGGVLRRMCVARHWGTWTLRYMTTPAMPCRKGAGHHARHVRAKEVVEMLPEVRETVRTPNELLIIDIADLRLRVAVSGRGELETAARLATELGADISIHSTSYRIKPLRNGNGLSK